MTIASAAVRLVGKDDTALAFRSVVRNAETAQKQITTKLRAAFNFLGAGTAVYALTRAISSAIKAGDDLAKFAQKSGLGAEAASELAHAAKMADIELGSLEVGVKKMQVTLSQAASGNKTATATLTALGLKFEDLKAMKPDQQFELIADRISMLKDPADKTRAAVELFGRAGADLLPLFEQGAAGIRAARLEAQQLGQSFSAEDLARFQLADTAFKQLAASSRGLAAELSIKLAPALAAAANAARDLLKGDIDWGVLAKIMAGGSPTMIAVNAAQALYGGAKKAELMGQNGVGDGISSSPSRGGLMTRAAPPGFAPEVKDLTDKIAALKPVMVTAQKIVTDFNAMLKNTATDAEQAALKYDKFRIELKQLLDQGLISADEFNKRMDAFFDENLKTVQVTAERLTVANDKAKTFMATLKDESVRQMFTAISDTIASMGNGMDAFAASAINAFKRIIANKATEQLFSLFAGVGNGNGGFLDFIGGLFGGSGGGFNEAAFNASSSAFFAGTFAKGGFIGPGKVGIAGEGGQPELIFGGRQGKTVVPMGGGAPVYAPNISIHVDTRADRAAVRQETFAIVTEVTRRGFQEFRDMQSRR